MSMRDRAERRFWSLDVYAAVGQAVSMNKCACQDSCWTKSHCSPSPHSAPQQRSLHRKCDSPSSPRSTLSFAQGCGEYVRQTAIRSRPLLKHSRGDAQTMGNDEKRDGLKWGLRSAGRSTACAARQQDPKSVVRVVAHQAQGHMLAQAIGEASGCAVEWESCAHWLGKKINRQEYACLCRLESSQNLGGRRRMLSAEARQMLPEIYAWGVPAGPRANAYEES